MMMLNFLLLFLLLLLFAPSLALPGGAGALHTTSNVQDSETCAYANRLHADIKPYELCPDVLTEQTGSHYAAFNKCRPLPHRLCVSHIPDSFILPRNKEEFRHNPPSENVRLSMPGSRFPDFKGFAAREKEDCVTCWRFEEERARWSKFLNFIERMCGFSFNSGPIRTVLDFGCGSGGFLSALADRGVFGLGFARNWEKLPYLETAAARGVMAMHMDFRNTLPMVNGAVDMVHCSWLMNILETREEIEGVLMEWDRLVRPGGFIVQYGFRALTEAKFNEAVKIIRRVANLMRWSEIRWHSKKVLFFIYQKPLRRQALGSLTD